MTQWLNEPPAWRLEEGELWVRTGDRALPRLRCPADCPTLHHE